MDLRDTIALETLKAVIVKYGVPFGGDDQQMAEFLKVPYSIADALIAHRNSTSQDECDDVVAFAIHLTKPGVIEALGLDNLVTRARMWTKSDTKNWLGK